ncbi:hypothetical protein CRUP_011100 [Coryphaenoides rupestris]|nr:hypothetical protein CRUP_011100 [Coryphaenoides rupestris]
MPLIPNCSCTGQPMERASISALSPAYLLDTQEWAKGSIACPPKMSWCNATTA